MTKKLFFILLALSLPFISFSENCSFIITLDNPDNVPYELVVKQLKQPQTQSNKTSYTPLTLTQKTKNEWQFVTLPTFHVIEIDFYNKSNLESILGGWTIGFKNDCLIQSVGNKQSDTEADQISLNIVNTKGSQENLLKFTMNDKKETKNINNDNTK